MLSFAPIPCSAAYLYTMSPVCHALNVSCLQKAFVWSSLASCSVQGGLCAVIYHTNQSNMDATRFSSQLSLFYFVFPDCECSEILWHQENLTIKGEHHSSFRKCRWLRQTKRNSAKKKKNHLKKVVENRCYFFPPVLSLISLIRAVQLRPTSLILCSSLGLLAAYESNYKLVQISPCW